MVIIKYSFVRFELFDIILLANIIVNDEIMNFLWRSIESFASKTSRHNDPAIAERSGGAVWVYAPIITEFFENEEEMAKFQKWREEYEEKEHLEKEEKAKKKAGAA